MINIENLINDGNTDILDVYDDGKCKYNSFVNFICEKGLTARRLVWCDLLPTFVP